MQIFSTIIFLLIGYQIVQAQQVSISGKVIDSNDEPLTGATIQIDKYDIGTVTDVKGFYKLKNVPIGNYVLVVSSVGYTKQLRTVVIEGKSAITLDFVLKESVSELGEVVVRGKSQAQEIAEQSIQISSIDARSLQVQAVEATRVLDELPGVRIRQSGGFGSQTEIQLNGAVGNAVRLYYDGIPVEYIGSGLSINNLPINMIDRIDVYKGVMPVEIGTDALGGGINLIQKKFFNSFLDASYEIGSFNTHRATFNAYHAQDSNFFIGFNGFFNYAENNYKMEVTNNIYGRTDNGNLFIADQEDIEIERFHNDHQSYFAEFHGGIRDKKWADELSYRIGYTSRYDEFQHGARVGNIPAGEITQEENAIIQRLTYIKNGLLNGFLDINYQGTLNFVNELTLDSTINLYDWRGQVIQGGRTGDNASEVLGRPTSRDIDQTSTSQRLTTVLRLHEDHDLTLSHFYARQKFVGEDPFGPQILGQDPNKTPAILAKNISGISYQSRWFNEKLIMTLFGKYYQYSGESIDLFQVNASVLPLRKFEDETWGYGTGIKWVVNNNLFVRSSYEQATRIPDEAEIFGNFTTARPNYSIRPERSDNFNLGIFYQKYFNGSRSVKLDLNTFLRLQEDLIFFNANDISLGQFKNQDNAEARGIELALSGRFSDALSAQLNLTKQRVINTSENLNDVSVGKPIPNRPDFFVNSSLNYSLCNLMPQDKELSFTWSFNYIEEFNFILDGGQRNDDNWVPRQILNDFGATYQIKDKGLSLSLQVNNILDAEAFDNISIPRPGRNYRFKIRYLFKNS
ncbi:MAG: TonB-dependent receptor [Bacteroidota bacterium]